MNIAITLPDGSVREMPAGSSPADLAASIGRGLARDAVAAIVDGVTVDVGTALNADVEVSIITIGSPEGVEIMRHSTSHVMAAAVGRIFGDVKFGIGPAITDGFYYDFDLDAAISSDDLEKIEAEMAKIVAADEPFVREDVLRADAIEMMRQAGQLYKVELLEDLEVERVSLYRTGDFVDLCLGPHLPSTGKLGVVKLLSVAGAYWRGDSDRPQLQRIYGTVWNTKKELKKHLHRLAEAEKRDHRRLGKELDLFSMDEEIGQGLVLWHPNGTLLRTAIEDFWKAEHAARGYQMVVTPHIASEKVYLRSGHIPKYEEMMYAPLEIDGQRYRLKPMNCPAHIKIFNTRTRSYRDLPIRYGELGTVYRYEMSGALQGMLRVRGFTQDDAHIFCTPEQLADEIADVLDLAGDLLTAFGYTYKAYLATRPEVSLDTATDAEWEMATASLRRAMEMRDVPYEVDEGGGAFYAPKIDIKLCDALGREWQGPTIQVDLNAPKRFDVQYIGEDGKEHECIIVHRTVLGSMERFVGGLIEHFGGWFPVWLAPQAARVLPITDDHNGYARQVLDKLRAAGIRADVDERNETMGYKIRSGTVEKVPYLLVVGDREVEDGTVSVRSHDAGREGTVAVDALVERLKQEIATKKLPKGFDD
jgi:threonyl-tRNA synthetase